MTVHGDEVARVQKRPSWAESQQSLAEALNAPTPEPAPVVAASVDLDSLNKADLKALAAERGLQVSGTKAEIKARLEE